MSAIQTDLVNPTIDETRVFLADGELLDESLSQALEPQRFAKGDKIEVLEGDLRHLKGEVLSVSGRTLRFLPLHNDLKEALEIETSKVMKLFAPADQVKIVEVGKYEHETGIVARIEGPTAFVILDANSKEVQVRCRGLQLTDSVSTGLDSLGQFQLHDLVKLADTSVGCIIRISKEEIKVLDQNGAERTVFPEALAPVQQRFRAMSHDSQQNEISKDCLAKIVDGPGKNREGAVIHIYRSSAFMKSPAFTEHHGVFVCKTNKLLVAGGKRADPTKGLSVPQSPRLQSAGSVGGVRGPASAPRVGGRGPPRRSDWINERIRVIKGPHKGYVGFVKDATDTMARVELHANNKIVSIEVNALCRLSDAGQASTQGQYPRGSFGGSQTPLYGSQTPMFGSQTPMYGSQTPMLGSETPLAGSSTPRFNDGSRTPSYTGHWLDPKVPNTPFDTDTPLVVDEDDDATSKSSSFRSQYVGGAGVGPSGASPYTGVTPAAYGATPGMGYGATPGAGAYGLGAAGSYGATPSFQPAYSPFSGYDAVLRTGAYPGASPGQLDPSRSPAFSGASPSSSAFTYPSPAGSAQPTPSLSRVDISWMIKGVCVTLGGGVGTLVDVSEYANTARVKVGHQTELVPAQLENIQPQVPRKDDQVIIIRGEGFGQTGKFLNIDIDDGIVKMNGDEGEFKVVPMQRLCKFDATVV